MPCIVSAPAFAQVAGQVTPPPVRQPLDDNGVDVARGTFVTDIAQVSIGGARGLSYAISTDGVTTAFGTIEQTGSTLIVTIDGRSDSFTTSGSNFISTEGNGATLVLASGTYTYTSGNGVKAVFASNSGYPYPFYEGEAGRLGGISYPDGSGRTFTFRVTTFCPQGYENGVCQGDIFYVGRLQSVQSSHGYQLKFAYGFNDTVANKVSDANYDTWGRVTSVTAINNAVEYCDPTASTCSLNGSWPKLTFTGTPATSVTDSLNRTTTFTPTSVTRPGGSSVTATTNAGTGRVQSVTNAGVNYAYTYADVGTVRTTTVTDPNSSQRIYTVDLTKVRVTSYKDEMNRITAYAYDADGRTTEVTYPEGNKVQYTYDARGNVTQTRAISKTPGTPPDIVTSASFDATCSNVKTCNKPNSRTDAKGNLTDYTYDRAHGGLLTVSAPAATGGGIRPQTRYTYASRTVYSKPSAAGAPAAGAIIPVPVAISTCQTLATCAGTADEVKTSIDYGPQVAGTGNNLLPVSVSSGSGDGALTATVSATYDSTGNRLTIDGPLAGSADTTRTRYDAVRQVLGVVGPDPDGGGSLKHRAQRLTYNLDGQVTVAERGTVDSQSDPDWAAFASAEAVTTSYDANARKVKDVLSSGGTTYAAAQYEYNSLGRLKCSATRMNPAVFASLPSSACTLGTQGTGAGDYGPDRIVRTTYDAVGRLANVYTAYGTAEQAHEVTAYTANGQVTHVIDAEANRTGYSYDGHDRLAKTEYPSATKGANAVNPSDYETLIYDANGNVIARRLRDAQVIGYTYDNLDRPTAKDLPGAELDIAYAYDLLGRPTSASQTNASMGFVYDALGRTVQSLDTQGNVGYSYDAAGRRLTTVYPTYAGGAALSIGYDYDLTGQVTAIKENGSVTLATYAYDNLGRRSTVTFGNGVVQSYAFDRVSRLQSLTSNLGGTAHDQTATFGYNPASQIDTLSKTNDLYAWISHYNTDRVSAGNGLNQMTAATPGSGQTSVPVLGYDSKGNLTGIGSAAYSYTSENQLTSGPGAAYIGYDPLGRMLRTYTTGPATRYQYAGTAMIAEYSGGSLQHRYVHGPGSDAPIVWYEGTGLANKRYLTADERGSIVAVTDSSGVAIAINSYDEYGNPASNNLGRFGYTGQTWLPELQMWYYKARIYNPALNRFMQTDPIGYNDGMNWYDYVGSDPVNFTDPSGMCEAVWEHRYYQNAQGVHRTDRVFFKGFANCNVVGTSGFSAGDRQGSGSGNGQYDGPEIVVTAQMPQKKCVGPPTGASGAGKEALAARSRRNADEAKWLSPLGFRNKVRNGGEWDYKQGDSELQDYGNYNYGYTGNAAGFGLGLLLRQAGAAQRAARTSKPEWGDPGFFGVVGGTAPYGDDPHDQEMITRGFNDREKGC